MSGMGRFWKVECRAGSLSRPEGVGVWSPVPRGVERREDGPLLYASVFRKAWGTERTVAAEALPGTGLSPPDHVSPPP